jgi:hypothetical protein
MTWSCGQLELDMNERIKELEAQCHRTFSEHHIDLDRFAELIVRECYETIKKDMELAQIQLLPLDFGMYANGRLRRIIKEHFGVEE